MSIIRNDDGKLVILDADEHPTDRVRFLSEEQYTITDDYNNIHRDLKGKLVRLISGVDFSDVPGYHYKPGWTTFIPSDGMPKFGVCGIECKYLKLVE